MMRRGNHLLRLPWEVRNLIWKAHFDSITLVVFDVFQERYRSVFQTAIHPLAMLRVSHQVYQETKDLWLNRTELEFSDFQNLIDKLAPLNERTLRQTKCIKLAISPLMLRPPGFGGSHAHHAADAFTLFSGLRLERLTLVATAKLAPP